MNLKIHEMENLRIEEGKRMKIGQTGNPLDGTWTRPSKALRRVLFIQQSAVLVFLVIVFSPMMAMMLLVDPVMMPLTFMLFAPVFVTLAIMTATMYWSTGRLCKNHRFRITDEELIIEGGLLTINRTLLPLCSIYEVNTIEGYWHRKYGIKSVMVGGNELMGLRNGDEVAEAILARVKLAKAKARAEL